MLVPLEHGYVHPRILARSGAGLMGRSSVIPASSGSKASGPHHKAPFTVKTLGGHHCRVGPGRVSPPWPRPIATPAEADAWNLGLRYLLAVRDGRAAMGPTLAEDGSTAGLQGAELLVAGAGPRPERTIFADRR